jgi:hypothetical protein
MSFRNTFLPEIPNLQPGELIYSSPGNVSAFEKFEDNLAVGRFAKFESGLVKNLDGSATPILVGVPKRKISGEIANEAVYSVAGQGIDSVAEVINFGFATVSVTDTATPSKFDPVNVINAAGADAGKATNAAIAAGIISAGDVVFWEQKADNVWLVLIRKYM